jgi:hypothetical protein
MKITKFFYVKIVFIIASCGQGVDEIAFPQVKLNSQSSGKLSDFFQRVELVELVSKDSGIWIGNIDLYKVTENHIYLLDESQGKKIMKFNHQGDFIAEVISVGESPLGFNIPSIFSIDESLNEMLVFDRTMLKLLTYDLNFRLIKSEKLPNYYSNISHLRNGDGYLYFPDDYIEVSNDYILTYQKSKEVFKPILYTKYPMIPFSSESFLYNDQSGFYHVPFEDKIFRYNADSSRFDPLFQLILNSEKIPSDLLEGLDILAVQSFLLDSEMSFASFSGSEYRGNYFLFYYRDLENYNFVRISKNDFDDNISISWKGLFDNADVPVPFASSAGMYYSVGYLSESDYKTVSITTGILDGNIEYKDFEDKLFLFKFYLK